MKNRKPILLTGCTAIGKSKLANALAEKIPSIIINADALQVYDCWQILSARPTAIEMELHEHALYGHVSLLETYDVGQWLTEVRIVLDEAKQANLRPIIVGGTGLFLSLLLSGIADIPPISKSTRLKSNNIRKSTPIQFLNDLKKVDPEVLTNIDNANIARLQRAWEVFHETGKSILTWQKISLTPVLKITDVIPIVLYTNKDILVSSINKRFKKMVSMGVVDEVKKVLSENDVRFSEVGAFKAIGFQEICLFLENKLNANELEDAVTIKTRQFAKRQRTWFRNRFGSWNQLEISKDNKIKKIIERIDSII